VTRSSRRRLVATLFGIAVGALAALATPAAPASAHALLVQSTPGAGSVLATAPAEVVLVFSEPVGLVAGQVKILGPGGGVASGAPSVRGAALHVPLTAVKTHGTYVVSYRVISADTHPVGGALTFSIGAPSANAAGVAGASRDAGRVDPVVSVLMAAARWVGFVGMVLLIGVVTVIGRLWPRRLPRRGPARLGLAGVATIAVATVAEVLLQAPYGAGTTMLSVTGGDLRAAAVSRLGVLLLIRLVALAGVAALARPMLTQVPAPASRRLGRARGGAMLLLGTVGLLTWPLSGHPGASRVSGLSVAADTAHLAAVGVWLVRPHP